MLVVRSGINGQITIGEVSLGIAAIAVAGSAAASLVDAVADANESRLFLGYFRDLGDLKPDLNVSDVQSENQADSVNFSKIADVIKTGTELGETMIQSERIPGLELRNVSFRYHQSYPWVLHNLNLTVPVEQSIAIVGLNGAGKSTLVKLLARLYDPTEGAIFWNGVDLRELNLEQWRREIGIVFQGFMSYETTIRENIGVGNLDELNNDRLLLQAIDTVGMTDKIQHLPEGIDTEASLVFGNGPTGIDLSMGQWQKIALARVLIRKSSLLVLDEPTSSLDVSAEAHFNTLFKEATTGRTSIIIAHRPSPSNSTQCGYYRHFGEWEGG